jgi:hypothetical protein
MVANFEEIAAKIMGAFQGDEELNDVDLLAASGASRNDYMYVRDTLLEETFELNVFETDDGTITYTKVQPLGQSAVNK